MVNIEKLCVDIRNLLDEWHENGTLYKINDFPARNFPYGWCGIVSEVLAVIIYKLTGDVVTSVSANDENIVPMEIKNHMWIEYQGLTIDLTGDQFNNDKFIFPSVICNQESHPLSSVMSTKRKSAYLIGVTKKANAFDLAHVRLISMIEAAPSIKEHYESVLQGTRADAL